ncbi:MAG: hypothetical protein IJ686_03575 [Bacteroidales bacterium]|nr:hypothetical protein [Bacteroidales bacterium]
MENNLNEILAQLRSELDSISAHLSQLQGIVADLEAGVAASAAASAPAASEPEAVSPEPETPVASEPEAPEFEPEVPELVEIGVEDLPSGIIDEPVVEPAFEPEPVPAPSPAPAAPAAKPSAPAASYRWATDLPGSPVKNVISAVSLNDRVLFINTLFGEDPLRFQHAIAVFNGLPSFADAVEYVQSTYPDWDLSSEVVYRLMMAVRRRFNG